MNQASVLTAVLSLFSSCALAGAMGEVPPAETWSRVVTLGAGPAWARGGEAQTFFLQPDVAKTYTARTTTQVLANGDVFAGLQHRLTPALLGQIGLAFAGSSDAKLQGDIWDDADPDFNNFRYQYRMSHARIAVKGKLAVETSLLSGLAMQPYVSGSLGAGFNNTHDFIILPKLYEQLPAPAFTSHTKTAFAYTAGAGLQKTLSSRLLVGVGYEFADWGKSRLNRAPEQTLGRGLRLNHFLHPSIAI